MNLFRKTNHMPTDSVPEEDDGLVDVLREAYASTPIPPSLVSHVQEGVRTAGNRPAVKQTFRAEPRIAWAAIPLGIGLVALAFLAPGLMNPNKPTASPASQKHMAANHVGVGASVVWTNAPHIPIHVRTKVYKSGQVRASYALEAAPMSAPRYSQEKGQGYDTPVPVTGTDMAHNSGHAPVYSYSEFLPSRIARCPAIGFNSGKLNRMVPCARVNQSQAKPHVSYVLLVASSVKTIDGITWSSPAIAVKHVDVTQKLALRAIAPKWETCPKHDHCWLIRIRPEYSPPSVKQLQK